MVRGNALTATECDRIIHQEVRRFGGHLPGYDTEDLQQECRMALASRLDLTREGARTYVRQVTQDKLTNLLRMSTTQSRCPHDAWGRPRPSLAATTIDDAMPASHVNVERDVEHRQAITYLRDRLDARDWQQLTELAIAGAVAVREEDRLNIAGIRQKAATLLRCIGYRVTGESEDPMANQISIPAPPADDTPECHVSGKSPVGYDPTDAQCPNCRDKFTCLPQAIEQKLVSLTLKADLEVAAVIGGRLGFMEGISRMKVRVGRAKAGQQVLAEESPTWPGLLLVGQRDDEEPSEAEAAKNEAPATTAEEDAPISGTVSTAAESGEEDTDVAKGKTKGSKAKKPAATKPAKKPTAAKPVEVAKVATPPAPVTKVEAPKAASKPAAAPAPVAVAAAALEPRVLPSGLVKLGDLKLGRVEKTRAGWGWWAINGAAESTSWLTSEALAVAGLVRWARSSKGPLAPALGADAKLLSAPDAPAPKGKAPPVAKAKAAKAEPVASEPAVERPKNWPTMANGKPLPAPKKLSEEEMVAQLAEAQSKLGANIQLDYGMEIARRKRGGDTVVVIRPHGFEYTVSDKDAKAAGFESPTQLFGSLSSVAMWAEKRMVSGNDFFNLSKHNCTEARDKQGRIIDRKGGVALRT